MEPLSRTKGRKPERRPNLTVRCRNELRDKLDIEAKRNGRSLSEEIEIRLERSFEIVGLVNLQYRIAELERREPW
jgi:hypothetical protein